MNNTIKPMRPVEKVITTYNQYKDSTKDDIINAMRSIDANQPLSQVEHETLVYILLNTDFAEN